MNKEEKLRLIKKICEEHKITAYEIAKATNLSAVGIQKFLNGETKNPNKNTINLMWQYISKLEPPNISIVREEIAPYEKGFSNITPNISKKEGVPYYNVDFASGYDLFTNDQTISADFYISYEPYNHADLWVNNIGNSMSPKIDNGDIVALKKIEDINQILYGEIYAIVFPEIRTIKYVRKSTLDDHVRLVPHDLVNYDEQDMPKKLIHSFFLVLGSIKKFF